MLIFATIVGAYVLNKTNIVSDAVFWLVILGVVLLGIFDYYWFGGKLNKEGRHYGKK